MAAWQPLLEQVARERYPRLVARAMLVSSSRSEAEDLVSDALIASFSGRARFTSLAEAEAYVRRAIVSRSIDTGRRRAVERRALSRLRLERESVDEILVPGLAPSVEAALARLSPRERACVVLRHLEDLSVRDVAGLLQLSEGAVKRYTSDAVASLNSALGTTDSRDTVRVMVTDGRSTDA
ncbi:sigma-70 family RNA polymerase sigma factor [Pengzhenrongella phosphoraccumulans]|uniref:sigma-70 family RNA polymerase sigma factor n=1 Tax=Pengzhenrongella phosphoraccumulans TaxID=3114394 RepID=UPI00388E22C7